jgi:predicted O-methyltransferase YrrM
VRAFVRVKNETRSAKKMILRQSLRKAAYKFAPRVMLDGYHHFKLVRQARLLCDLREMADDPRVWIDELMSSHFFHPYQVRSEILRLLEIIKARRPRTICEIGAAGGGTTFLFSHAAPADSTIITVDLNLTRSRRAAFREFAKRPRQKIICVRGDSHQDKTFRAVNKCLKGRGLDLLYIDGDHSYEGVAADFKLYSPLVNHGGMIVFHDIVADYKTRYGVQTSSYTGGVPQLWMELKAIHPTVLEIIEDPSQDGLGIGILFWNGTTRAAVS